MKKNAKSIMHGLTPFSLMCLLIACFCMNTAAKDKSSSFAIYEVSVLPGGKISLSVYERNDAGEWLSGNIIQLSVDGRILKNLVIHKDEKNRLSGRMLGYDDEDNLWLRRIEGGTYDSVINIYKVKNSDVRSKTFNPIFQLSLPNRYPPDPQMLFLKNSMLIYPNLLSLDKGNTWTTLFKDVDFYPQLIKGNEKKESVCNYTIFQDSIYKCTIINDGVNTESISIEKIGLTDKKWITDSNISLKGKNASCFNMDYLFLISDKYYVLSNENSSGQIIHVYDRRSKLLHTYENVAKECSNYDITGVIPNVIIDDLLFADCPRGGYVTFDLRNGKVSGRNFSQHSCNIIKPPVENFMLLNCGVKLFMSDDKGKNWKEIFDVRSLDNLQEK